MVLKAPIGIETKQHLLTLPPPAPLHQSYILLAIYPLQQRPSAPTRLKDTDTLGEFLPSAKHQHVH